MLVLVQVRKLLARVLIEAISADENRFTGLVETDVVCGTAWGRGSQAISGQGILVLVPTLADFLVLLEGAVAFGDVKFSH